MNLIDIFSSMEAMEDGKKRQGVMDDGERSQDK
jgi:hypothetical protein